MSKFDGNYYNYQEIAKATVKDGATFEEKERLARWLDRYDLTSWNGEEWKVDRIEGDPQTYRMKPVTQINPDDPDEFITVDYEIY